MLPPEEKYFFELCLRQDVFLAQSGFYFGMCHSQTFSCLEGPLQSMLGGCWGRGAGLPPSPLLARLPAFCWKSRPHGEPRGSLLWSNRLMVDARKPWRWQGLSGDGTLTILWSQKLGVGGTVTSGNAPGNAAKHPPTRVVRGPGSTCGLIPCEISITGLRRGCLCLGCEAELRAVDFQVVIWTRVMRDGCFWWPRC